MRIYHLNWALSLVLASALPISLYAADEKDWEKGVQSYIDLMGNRSASIFIENYYFRDKSEHESGFDCGNYIYAFFGGKHSTIAHHRGRGGKIVLADQDDWKVSRACTACLSIRGANHSKYVSNAEDNTQCGVRFEYNLDHEGAQRKYGQDPTLNPEQAAKKSGFATLAGTPTESRESPASKLPVKTPKSVKVEAPVKPKSKPLPAQKSKSESVASENFNEDFLSDQKKYDRNHASLKCERRVRLLRIGHDLSSPALQSGDEFFHQARLGCTVCKSRRGSGLPNCPLKDLSLELREQTVRACTLGVYQLYAADPKLKEKFASQAVVADSEYNKSTQRLHNSISLGNVDDLLSELGRDNSRCKSALSQYFGLNKSKSLSDPEKELPEGHRRVKSGQ